MRTRYSFLDPGAIIGVVVALVILAVGVYAFYTTIDQIPAAGHGHAVQEAINNTTDTGATVFNVIGIVLTIGAIMAIVGIVYQYIR